ncbi:MAG: ECF transporter S component [Oscillospiraceae bacterium]|nr:ECF transporter S component [Oscillospiraceae bacterium]
MANSNNGRAIRKRTLMLAQMGVLIAIMLIFHLTGIGYIKVGIFSLTIMMIPVIIGAITSGPLAGAILGGVFGMTILFLPETQFFMGVNPIATIVLVVGTRGLLVGFIGGMVYKLLGRFDKKKIWSLGVTGLLTSLLNTFVLIAGLAIIFYESLGETRTGVFTAFISALAVQAVIEAVICTLFAVVIARILIMYLKKN